MKNRNSNFINLISPLDCRQGEWRIGLIFLNVSLTATEKQNYQLLTLHVEEVACVQGGDNIRDSCIYQQLNSTRFPHQVKDPIYWPLRLINHDQLHISLRNEDLIEVGLTQRCIMTFHLLRDNMSPPMKILRTFSNLQIDLFPDNEPLRYINKVSPLFHEDLDFTKWEIALESVIIDKFILQKMVDSFDECDFISVYLNIIKDQAIGDRACKLLTYVPILIALPPVNKMPAGIRSVKIATALHYRPLHSIFVPISKHLLDEIEVTLSMDYAKKKPGQIANFKFSEEERAEYMVNINFILRKL